MATYTENSRRDQVTTIVNVTYILSDNTKVIVDVPIFMPQSEDDIQLGITNRGISEENNLQIRLNGDQNNS